MYKILIVDDEPLVAKALGRAMARQGFEVVLARTAEEALPLLDDLAPDVVISDFNMPGMNGLELLRQVEVRAPRAVRIILSGCADPNSPFVAHAASDRFRVVRKPWDNKQLAAVLREMLRQRDAGCDTTGVKSTPADDVS